MELLIIIGALFLAVTIIEATWWQEERPCSVCKGDTKLYPWDCPLCGGKGKR